VALGTTAQVDAASPVEGGRQAARRGRGRGNACRDWPQLQRQRREEFEAWGFDVTVCIAAITGSGEHIVTASDRMISYNGVIPAGDDAALKSRTIAKAWGLMFAGEVDLFLPILNSIGNNIDPASEYDLQSVQNAVCGAYSKIFDEYFTSKYLSRYRIDGIATFRTLGLTQFGQERFSQICDQIDSFDLGIEVLGYGFDTNGRAHIFQVSNPGQIVNHDLLGYGVVGSGYWMATAALMRKKLPYNLNAMAYRLLDAKFSAETAPGVGRSTTLFSHDRNGKTKSIGYGSLDKIKAIWEATLKTPEPDEALQMISALLG
jgi:hypothetical protein